MTFPKDGNFINVEIERLTGGNLDETTGNWIDCDSVVIAEAEIDIQPKTGSEINSFQASNFTRTLIGFICIDDITFSSGFTKIEQGDLVDQEYKVVNVKDWLTHYELELKRL